MSDHEPSSTSGRCPRCRSTTIETRAVSPVAGVWTVFACSTCLYVWRSTEPQENQDPDLYPEAFRLVAQDLKDLPIAPAIQPADRQGNSG